MGKYNFNKVFNSFIYARTKNMGIIKYRFKGSCIHDIIFFEGAFINVGEFKRLIAARSTFQDNMTDDLVIRDQDAKILDDETQKIVNNSEVTVSKSNIFCTLNTQVMNTGVRSETDDTDGEENINSVNNKKSLILYPKHPLISKEEETVLKQRILGSVNSLYELGRSKTMKKSTKNLCRYYKEIGNPSRNCSYFKANGIRNSSILKIPYSKLLFTDKQTLHKRIIHKENNENNIAVVHDLQKKERKKNETNEGQYQIINEMKVNNEPKGVSIVIESIRNGKTKETNTNLHNNINLKCTFCGKLDHLWKECPIHCKSENVWSSNFIIKPKSSLNMSSKATILFPPVLLPLMPQGDNDLLIYAFERVEPLDKESFFKLQAEIIYRHNLINFKHI